MLTWIVQNIPTIIICLLLAFLVAAIIISMIRNKKKGKPSCTGGCRECPMGGSCHKH